MESTDIHFMVGLISIVYTCVQIVAIYTAVMAVRDTRTPQGSVAWAISLVTFPLISLPLYWVFGRRKFNGYVEAMRAGEKQFREMVRNRHDLPRVRALSARHRPDAPRCSFETMAGIPFMAGNELELLVDGKATFASIFRSIEAAERYILIQFFIVRADGLGARLRDLLLRKAAQGVHIKFLYDEIGCNDTPALFWRSMIEAGIEVQPFNTTKGRGNRFQLNFRNHRKIVIVDGHTAFVGGLNVGDEYLGLSKKTGPWRDTHLRITGPAVLGVRLSFTKDWYWATRELYDLDLSMPKTKGKAEVLTLATGPADDLESCSLMFIRAINASKKRFWIASPYYVPDSAVTKALQLAAMRGVDVRIMLPRKADHLLVYLAGYSSLHDLSSVPGIRVYRYAKGFLHEKVFLVDDELAAVGTANLDNRSFRLNFEMTIMVEDRAFCAQVEQMFLTDFKGCVETGTDEYARKSVPYQTAVKFARLLSPIL
ncbi:MAG: cardiolipin synthase [Pseudomonadota bacterium]